MTQNKNDRTEKKSRRKTKTMTPTNGKTKDNNKKMTRGARNL